MGISFEFLRAGCGDSILISIDDRVNILVDGGLSSTYARELRDKIKKEVRNKNLYLDLVVLTHYDDDHIGGILKFLEEETRNIQSGQKTILKELWFNSFDEAFVTPMTDSNKTSARQQIKFDEYIKELLPHINYKSTISIDNVQNISIGEDEQIKFILLSPNNSKLEELHTKYKKDIQNYETSACSNDYNISIKELSQRAFVKDTSISNGATIAFILEYKAISFLFLADAHINLITESLKRLGYTKKKPLNVEFVKLAHHGSSKNLNKEFLDLVQSKKFIVSTNGGRHHHPNKETLSRILTHPKRERLINGEFKSDIEFIYNYDHIRTILNPNEKKAYKAIFKNEKLSYL